MKKKSIGIIGAMECEITLLKVHLENIEEINQGILTFYCGKIRGNNVILVKSGVGKVCASVCTQILIDKFNPDFIINTGIAGAIDNSLKIGDIVIGNKLVEHDFDVSALGYARGYVCNGKNSKEPTYFYSDIKLIDEFKKSVDKSTTYTEGVIASGDIFIGDKLRKKELKDLFNAKAAEMEGAAIAHAATLNDVPFLIIRGISDLADENAAIEHDKVEQLVSDISSKTILTFLNTQ